MKRIYALLLLCLVTVSVLAQNVQISGQVTDEYGPVVGATVKVRGLGTGTTTDAEGKYAITVPKNAVLEFSYVGTETVTKKVAEGSHVIDVRLQQMVTDINEVVVTAIGIKQEKKKLGYTTQQVSGDKMAASGNVNAASSFVRTGSRSHRVQPFGHVRSSYLFASWQHAAHRVGWRAHRVRLL